jgi:hypothetical protein
LSPIVIVLVLFSSHAGVTSMSWPVFRMVALQVVYSTAITGPWVGEGAGRLMGDCLVPPHSFFFPSIAIFGHCGGPE